MDGAFFDGHLLCIFADLQFGVDEEGAIDGENDAGAAIRAEARAVDDDVVAANGKIREGVSAGGVGGSGAAGTGVGIGYGHFGVGDDCTGGVLHCAGDTCALACAGKRGTCEYEKQRERERGYAWQQGRKENRDLRGDRQKGAA